MSDKDVTAEVSFDTDDIDSECLPLKKCICGEEFDFWDFVLKLDRDSARECPNCKRKMYWSVRVNVLEVVP